MLMVIPNDGKLLHLMRALTSTTPEDWEVQLYSNNYTPVDTSVPADFTAATFTGAGVWTIAVADWSSPVIVSDVAEMSAVPFPEWTCTAGASQTVYGWFAVGANSGDVLAAQRFDTARVMSVGATEQLDPFTIRLKTFT